MGRGFVFLMVALGAFGWACTNCCADPPTITSLADVFKLSRAEVEEQRTVDAKGVVFYVDAEWNMVILRGDGVCAYASASTATVEGLRSVEFGDTVQVRGITKIDHGGPVVADAKFELLSNDKPPVPQNLDLNSMWSNLHGAFVRVTGKAIEVNASSTHTAIIAQNGETRFRIVIPEPTALDLAIVDQELQVEGILSDELVANGKRVARIFVPTVQHVRTSTGKPLPVAESRDVQDLATDGKLQEGLIRIRGVVVATRPDLGFFYLANDSPQVVRVESGLADFTYRGDTREVIGRLESVDDDGVTLVAATSYSQSDIDTVSTDTVSVPSLIEESPVGNLVSVNGRVTQVIFNSGEVCLVLNDRGDEITATITSIAPNDLALLSQLAAGDEPEVVVTGILREKSIAGSEERLSVSILSVDDIVYGTNPAAQADSSQLANREISSVPVGAVNDNGVASKVSSDSPNRSLWSGVACVGIATAVTGVGLFFVLRRKFEQDSELFAKEIARLRSVYDSVDEAVIVLDSSGAIIQVNYAAQEFLGINQDKCAEVDFSERLRHCLGGNSTELARVESLTDHPRDELRELTLNLERPQKRAVRAYSVPIWRSDVEVVGRLWVMQDATEQRLLEQRLSETHKQEALGQLAGGVAHNFNNLLSGITNSLQAARLHDREASERLDEFLGTAESAAWRGAELVANILRFARHKPMTLQPTNLSKIIEFQTDFLRQVIDASITIDFDLDDDLWLTIIDKGQFEHVLLNLVLNARDALPEGGIIQVRTGNGSTKDSETVPNHVVVEVSDNGIGMPEEVRRRAFDPFFTTKSETQGTGLGLAVSLSTIKAFGGWISCHSQVDVGTTFRIWLPRFTGSVTDSTDVIDTVDVAEAESPSGRRILIVDDEDFVLQSARYMLTGCGFSVECAASCDDAIDLLQSEPSKFDIAIVDMTMPGVSGVETMERMKTIDRNLPVVLCSGYAVDGDNLKTETNVRPDGYLDKPIRLDDILAAIEAAIARVNRSY